jgi:putative inorganic carbon (hco3(-)) transporter
LQLTKQFKIVSKNIPFSIEYLIIFLPLFTIYGSYYNTLLLFLYIFLSFILFVIINLMYNNFNIIFPKFFVWIPLLFWNFHSMLKSPVLGDGIYYYIGTVIVPFLLFIIISNIVPTERFISKVFDMIIISGVISSLYSIYTFLNMDYDPKFKIGGLWESQNIFSMYLMIIFLFNLSFVINKSKRKNLFLYLFSLITIFFAIILSQTRGVWLAIIISILFYFIKRPKVIFPFLIILGIMMLSFFGIFKERFFSVIYFTKDVSSLGRLQGWISSIILIKDNILLGYGYDSYIYLRDNVLPFYFVEVIHSHNTYLRMWLENGLIGFVLYFSIFATAIIYSFKNRKNKVFLNYYKVYIDGFQMSFIGLLVVFFFEPYLSMFDNSTLFIWIFISLMYSIQNYSNKFDENEQGITKNDSINKVENP